MGVCLAIFVAFNVYSSAHDAQLARDPSALQLSIAQRKLARREDENAILLKQRSRWLKSQSIIADGGLSHQDSTEGSVRQSNSS